MRKAPRAAVAGAIAIAAVGCGSDTAITSEPGMAQHHAATITIDQRADTFTSLQDTLQFAAATVDSAGLPITGDSLTWSSSISTLVTIDPGTGVATAQGNGTLFIRVDDGGVRDSVPVVVMQVPRRLTFELQPSLTIARIPFSPPVLIALHDARGNLVLRGTDSVALRLVPDGSNAVLVGADQAMAAAGIAQFNTVAIDRSGTGYRLVAVSGSLPSDTSGAFDVAPGTTFTDLSVGGGHVCGIATTGIAYCWGSDTFGQLGDDGFTARTNPHAVNLPAGVTLVTISAGGSHTCGVETSGTVYCWGNNSDGQIGDGTTVFNRSNPTPIVAPGLSFTAVSAGGAHSCAITNAGATYCWGLDSLGQVGDSTLGPRRPTPTPINHPTNWGTIVASAVSAGAEHTCILWGATPVCWGSFRSLQLGYTPSPPADNHPFPGFVNSPKSAGMITAGDVHTCDAIINDTAYCWGLNTDGELGDSTTNTIDFPIPVHAPAGVKLTAVAAGSRHSCGATADSTVYCWGKNDAGQLGNGTTTRGVVATQVLAPKNVRFTRVRAGGNATCALTSSGAAYCWGNGSLVPTPVGPPK